MFTFSFGSAMAATYSKDAIKEALQDRVDEYAKTLDTTIRTKVVNSYTYDDDGFATIDGTAYFSKDAINATITDIVDAFVNAAEQAIDTGVTADADTIDYSIVYSVEADYEHNDVLGMVKTLQNANNHGVLNIYAAADMKKFVEAKLDDVAANLNKYSDDNAKRVADLVDEYRAKVSQVSYTDATAGTALQAYGDLYFAADNFKAKLAAIPTLDKEDNTGADAEAAISAAVAEYVTYGLNTVYDTYKLTADNAIPANYDEYPAGKIDEIYEKGTGKKVTIFGVEVANKDKVTLAEATAVNRALRTAILDSTDAITAYAKTKDSKEAAVAAVNDFKKDRASFMVSLDKAVRAGKVYKDVVELGENYKAANIYGVKTYNDENVDKAVKKAEELVYAGIGKSSFDTPENYIKLAAAKLDINILEVNFELQKFEKAISDAIAKMYSNVGNKTAARKVTYGADKTPEADFVYLLETYATDADTVGDWHDIAGDAVASLLDAESYAEIEEIMANAAKDFSELTLRVDQKAVEAAKREYKGALGAYKTVHENLIDKTKYPNSATADVVTAGEKLIDKATTVAGVEAAYEEAKALFGTLKTKADIKAMEDSLKAAIKALDTKNLTVESKDAVMAVYNEYLAFVKTPGVSASDITGESKIADALKTVLDLEAKALQTKVDDMAKALKKVNANSEVAMASYVAMKADVEALIAEAKAFNKGVKAINDDMAKTGFAKLAANVDASKLTATIGASKAIGETRVNSFWAKEVTLVESALVKGTQSGANAKDMADALAAFEKLTDRQKYSLDANYLQVASVIGIKLGDAVESLKLTASSTAKKGSITVKWKVKGDASGVTYYEVRRSTKANSGYGTKPYFKTTKKSYKNTKALKKGTRYYYKVRAVAEIGGAKYVSDWSNKAYRKAK